MFSARPCELYPCVFFHLRKTSSNDAPWKSSTSTVKGLDKIAHICLSCVVNSPSQPCQALRTAGGQLPLPALGHRLSAVDFALFRKSVAWPEHQGVTSHYLPSLLERAVEHPTKDASPACPVPDGERESRPKDLSGALSPLQCAVPQFCALSPLECALTKARSRNPFRMRTYEKRWGGGRDARPLLRENLNSRSCYTDSPMPRQRLGQHFLADLDWREQIARAIRVSPHSTVPLPKDDNHCWIEIGAGHGEMTRHLLVAGGPVSAIELDPALASGLRPLAREFPQLNVVSHDILKTDLAALASGRRIRVYGNLPYYITSPILHHLFEFAAIIDEIHLVIQTEVAQRLAAQPGTRDYGYLSVVTQLYARPEFVFEIPREAFQPPPKVTSALVTLRLPGERSKLALRDEQIFLNFVKLSFSQKRKTLVNSLRALGKPEKIRAALASLDLRRDARAEQ